MSKLKHALRIAKFHVKNGDYVNAENILKEHLRDANHGLREF